MKRKRRSDQIDDPHVCDLILTDTSGRSIRVHKALLMDKSDYFARILNENNLNELQVNENYLIELIHYLYSHEGDDHHHNQSNDSAALDDDCNSMMSADSSFTNGDLVILIQLSALSKKYTFRQLYRHLMNEINYKLQPSTVLTAYTYAQQLGIEELKDSTRLMILSWLPQIQKTEAFFNLSEESINNIFAVEAPDVDNECKLNALSAWWSHNKDADMTNLWVKLITCANK